MAIRNSITDALPELRAAEAALRAKADALGIGYRIADFGGVRTLADTSLILGYRTADYAVAVARNPSLASVDINDWRPIAPFGSSFHNYGAAFDVLITSTPAGMTAAQALTRLKSLAPSVGLRSTVPNDPPHFELPITLEEAKARWGKPAPVIDATTAGVSAGVILAAILVVLSLARRR